MIININPEKCTGCSVCAIAMPDIIGLDHHNKAMVLQKYIKPDDSRIWQHAENCPGGAIEIS